MGVARNSDERNSWLKIWFKRSNSGWNRIGGFVRRWEREGDAGRDLAGVIRVNTSNNERPRKDEVTLPKSLQLREGGRSQSANMDGPVSGLARSSSDDGISRHISTLFAHDWPKMGLVSIPSSNTASMAKGRITQPM